LTGKQCVRKQKSSVAIIVIFACGKEVIPMWISKKKFNQMMAEAVEKEREREMMYRFMDEMHTRMNKLECQVDKNTNDIQNNYHYIAPPADGKKQLNG
jgi:hypothetical protein